MRIFAASLLAALVVGPMAQSMPTAPGRPAAPLAQTVADSPRQALESRLRERMPYAVFRRMALASGWAPVASNPPCERQVTEEICRQLPEIWSTSSGPVAYTELRLRHPSGVTINVLAVGDTQGWQTPGEEKSFYLERWEFE